MIPSRMKPSRAARFTIVLVLISIVLGTMTASGSMSVAGTIFKKDVSPGQAVKHQMIVKLGRNDSPLDVVVKVAGFGEDLSGGYHELNASVDRSPFSARSFLNVSPVRFHLENGTSQKVVLSGIVPPNVGGGTRFALVNIRSLPAGRKQAIGFSVAFNVPVVLNITGSEFRRAGEIMDLNVSGTNVSLIFKNTGNTHFKALAAAALKDRQGRVLSSATTPPTDSSIIPAASRRFRLSLKPETKLEPGEYVVDASVSLTNGTILATREGSLKIGKMV